VGVRTWTSFESKEEFDRWRTESGNQDVVVAQGVSSEDAKARTLQTSLEVRLQAALREEEENPVLAELHARNARFMALHRWSANNLDLLEILFAGNSD
jgi:hypothetical protein